MNDTIQHVKWFRDSSPYINAHRGRTFVIYVSGEAIADDNITNIVADIVLLHSLGVRLVLVHGAAPQISKLLAEQGLTSDFVDDVRVTTPEILPQVQFAIGKTRMDLEALLSKGVVNAPQHKNEITVVSGNNIKAKPIGIIDGQDFHHTGNVRKVNTSAIRKQLDCGAIVLVSPIGFSPTGEIFNINSAEVAGEVASALQADKLVLFDAAPGILDDKGALISELQVSSIQTEGLSPYSSLAVATNACLKGVNRCHLISYLDDGALLAELFTRDGKGTQIVRTSYETTRPAVADDIAGIIELISPLEAQGVLVKRSRELIEAEYQHFIVSDRDGTIVSCAALYPYENQGELACLATHPEYRDGKRGEILLKAIEAKAKQLGLESIFVLTTNTAHWFVERGFAEISVDKLPTEKQSLYNYQRNSKLFSKLLK